MEKYPEKRGYALGKLQKFLAKANLTKRFRKNCDSKGNRDISEAFSWVNSNEGFVFWEDVRKQYEHYLETGKVFREYED